MIYQDKNKNQYLDKLYDLPVTIINGEDIVLANRRTFYLGSVRERTPISKIKRKIKLFKNEKRD